MFLPKKDQLNIRSGYLAPPVIIVLALIVLFVAATLIVNAKLFPNPKSSPTPITQPSPSSAPSPIDETVNWKTYTTKEIGITLKYPQDYSVEESKFPLGVSFSSKDKTEGEFGVLKNGGFINIGVTKSKNKSLDEEFKNFFNGNLSVVSDKSIAELDSYSAIRATYTAGGAAENTELVLVIKNSTTYSITAWAAPISQVQINKTFDKILSTFQFL